MRRGNKIAGDRRKCRIPALAGGGLGRKFPLCRHTLDIDGDDREGNAPGFADLRAELFVPETLPAAQTVLDVDGGEL